MDQWRRIILETDPWLIAFGGVATGVSVFCLAILIYLAA